MSWLSEGLHCGLPLRGEGVRGVHGQLRRTVRQEIMFFFVNTSLKDTKNKCTYVKFHPVLFSISAVQIYFVS